MERGLALFNYIKMHMIFDLALYILSVFKDCCMKNDKHKRVFILLLALFKRKRTREEMFIRLVK